ncbi:Tafazzin [Strongyloides ratti]|uniref:Tafazzin family protein n=1 Tax=Strongyloides ratti TaxID=34506 RepID=A0A090LG18_STRRB|nr:Tafazzin [Strongyloides ratti]CEF68711.1 Tafazzin [Strongyloides ratti]
MKLKDIQPPNISQFKYPWPFPLKESFFFKLKTRLVTTAVFSLSKLLFIRDINKLQVFGKEKFLKCLEDKSKPLITMSNHRCNIDDPLMWSFLTFPEYFRNAARFRFILAASNICFTNPLYTKFFSAGRCVPCVRGEGVFQKGVDFSIDKLNEKEWIHIFPEGKVETRPIRIKWGIGRMVDECKEPPTIIPIWINGMDKVWPSTKPFYPRFGKTVKVIIGDPIDSSIYINKIPSDLKKIERRKILTDMLQEKLLSAGNASLGIEPKF